MKNLNNILIIYPQDPTIDFLEPIVDTIKESWPQSTLVRPNPDIFFDSITDETDFIFFLGHGNTKELFNGVNKDGEKERLLDVMNGARLFDGCSVVLFSCNSVEYLKKVQANPISIDNFFVFGDMPTDEEHIKHNQKEFDSYWPNYTIEQLKYYKEALVYSVINGIKKAARTNSFYDFYMGINHTINKKINDVIFRDQWTKKQKLQTIERLIEFRREIKYSDSI